jgi:uncharacterized protein
VIGSGLQELTFDDCIALLQLNRVGRIAVLVDEYPLVVPVNYRLVTLPGRCWLAIRTRPGSVIDRAATYVSFEIDGIDRERREGWSVVVRGTLHRVDPDVADFGLRFDPESWLRDNPQSWLVIDAFQVTGRRLRDPTSEWELELRGPDDT